ncbi:MAG: class I SAM-dependent methyltransferase [Xanthobacteraceae bacterium]|nr:class I SAM-dependent methyltransferase [Xanthobacteraceae bacterium]
MFGHGGVLTTWLAKLYPGTHFTVVDWEWSRKLNASVNGDTFEALSCDNYQITCRGAAFDKVVLSWALHLLQDKHKIQLLHEMRRVLRRGGTLYVVDYDRPESMLERAGLAYASRQYGYEAVRAHLDGTWMDTIRLANFADVRRMSSSHEITANVAVLRARRSL